MQSGIKLQPYSLLKDNRYRIVRHLADGGEGYVYLAQDIANNNQVRVIKQMYFEACELEGIEKDYQMFSGLFHPNIVQVMDFFWENHVFYVVMNYVAGSSLKNFLKQAAKPIDELKVLDWATRLAHILDFLHTRPTPIIHADVAPDNIVLTSRNDLILIDFGIARSNFEAVGLRPGYSAPEQMQGILDESCDVYSLGATMFRCLTGRNQAAPGEDPRAYNDLISTNTANLIKKATHGKRDSLFGMIKGRYHDMAEFLEAISESYVAQRV